MILLADGDLFWDTRGNRVEIATMQWGEPGTEYADETLTLPARTVTVGTAFEPMDLLGSISARTKSGGNLDAGIWSPCFGIIRRLLVADGDRVRPDQPLAEIADRPPTTEEWQRERSRAVRAELSARTLRGQLANPFRAFWVSLRHSYYP